MKNANELIEEEERDRKKAEKRRAKKKVLFYSLTYKKSKIQVYNFIGHFAETCLPLVNPNSNRILVQRHLEGKRLSFHS